MAAKPMRAARTKNGAATKVCASTTAAVVKGKVSPTASSAPPSTPRRPKAMSSASPATEGGSTTGRSTSSSSQCRPRTGQRASA